MELKVIAHYFGEFSTKFGIPRQSGLASTQGEIVFEKDFSDPMMLRGIEQYSRLWIIWGFSENGTDEWSATVRPPRLGGNKRVGVFATRSPFRPNPLGLSNVELCSVHTGGGKTVIKVKGADLLNGTPVYDIKPYIPYADAHGDSAGGFAQEQSQYRLQVILPDSVERCLPAGRTDTLKEVLALDPRPAYQDDPERVYGIEFAGYEVKFTVCGDTLTVLCAEPLG